MLLDQNAAISLSDVWLVFLNFLNIFFCLLNISYYNFNFSYQIKSSRMRWAGHVARMGERRGLHRVLVGKPEGTRPLERPRRRWEDNIKMDLQEVGGGCGDWMEMAQDREGWRALVSKMRGIS